ncbi:Dabb family protein [Streptomyces sp. NPDC092296]|uniref:Dabb family protein n=1 Tax=Streptomyces sp. NPDC092296 TaxID=3366012 RepID=UPI003805C077
MLEHYVVFRPHPGREDRLADAVRELAAAVAGAVPGLLELTWGENTNPSGLARGYTHGCLGRFQDARAFDAYWEHPAHQRFMARLDEVCADRFAIDYATGGTDPVGGTDPADRGSSG